MANTTAMASGVNRKRAVPVSSSTGTKTMQMERVATKVGTAICEAPSSTAVTSGFRMARLRWVFSISTVASSTRMPTARARPPRVITLMVSPSRLSRQSEVRMERGMEMQTIRVLRQLPRKSRIMRPVRPAAISASRNTPLMEARTKTDWSASAVTFNSGETLARMFGRAALTALTMARVEACPLRVMVINTPRDPLVRTMLFCT